MNEPLHIERHKRSEDQQELFRILSFSDGVFAIAVTFLAFGIGTATNLDPANLRQELLKLFPQIGIYGLSFLVIGDYWVIHHRIFRNIKRYDNGLIWLNVLFLLCVAFLPVPSRIFGQFPTERPAIIFFDACLIITGIVQSFIWRYASAQHRLLDPNFSPKLILWGKIRGLIPPTVQMISIGLSFISPILAILSWGFIWIGFAALNYFYPIRQGSA
jgi:uncharacterized membrane protein